MLQKKNSRRFFYMLNTFSIQIYSNINIFEMEFISIKYVFAVKYKVLNCYIPITTQIIINEYG